MVLVGEHPVLMQVPPKKLFSISATCHPKSASRNESGTPACPEPITIASYFIHEALAFLRPFEKTDDNWCEFSFASVAPAFRRASTCIHFHITRTATRSPTTSL